MASVVTAPKDTYDSSELDLIRRARGTQNSKTGQYEGRDEAAFTELYNRTYARVRALCYRMMRSDTEGADETINRTFIRIWERLHQFQGDSAFTTWVTRIAINEVLMYLRKNQKHRGTVSYDTEVESHGRADDGVRPQLMSPVSEMEALIDRERIVKAMLRVPVKYRPVLKLRFIDGLSNEEIFSNSALRAKLDIKSLASLKSMVYRGRRMFLSALETISACPSQV